MLTIELNAATLANVRFTPSPAFEATEWLWYAATNRPHPSAGTPGPAARAALRHPDVALVTSVLRGRGSTCIHVPDLLTPRVDPGRPDQLLRQQLETLAATAPEVAARQVSRRFSTEPMPGSVRAAVEAGSFGSRAANGLWHFWRAALSDEWTGLRSTLEADVARRADLAVRQGLGAVFDSLHPALLWREGRLEVAVPEPTGPGTSRRSGSGPRPAATLTGGELTLVPSVLGWPLFRAQFARLREGVLMYPARGADVRRPSRRAAPDLVGRSRAALLRDLGAPTTTSELSGRHSLAPATVSYHLGVLHRAGMVTRFRDGARVLYRRTPAGDALVGADPLTTAASRR